jgi:4-diphosphocytidyl-2-C-methyl-D-erythritol kinase
VSGQSTAVGAAPAKINLALLVGPPRTDGKHEVVTILQRLELADEIRVRSAGRVAVVGFPADTLVRGALEAVRARTGVAFAAEIEKRIPVASGLGGGSSDAATALRLANGLLEQPLAPADLHEIAALLGSDVPFFLEDGAQLAVADGTVLSPQAMPQDYAILLALPRGVVKTSTADVYASFDERRGWEGFAERRELLLASLESARSSSALALLPRNDLASSPLAARLERLGSFRADVSGAGPVVYGLFTDDAGAREAAASLAAEARVWVTAPRWYR